MSANIEPTKETKPFSTLMDVEKVYEKDPNLKKDDVSAILQWTKTQPHLPEVTELFAILALHSCYYQTEAAKKTIDKYFTFRTLYADYFTTGPEDVIRRVFSVNFISVLPKRTPEDDMVVLLKFLDTDPKLFHCVDQIRLTVMVMTLYMFQHGPAGGLVLLGDMEGVSFGHLFRMNVMAVKRMILFLQEAAPLRIKALHYLNTGMTTARLMSVLKPFMKKEIADAIKLHPTSVDTLYEYVPRECLPKEYGGELPPVMTLHEECLRNLLDNLDILKWHDAQVVDESKRLKS